MYVYKYCSKYNLKAIQIHKLLYNRYQSKGPKFHKVLYHFIIPDPFTTLCLIYNGILYT